MGLLINIVKSVVAAIKEKNESSKPEVQPKKTTPTQPQRTLEEWKSYFREILISDFPQYSFRENIPVTDVVGFANDEFQLYKDVPRKAYEAEWGRPYDFVLYQGSTIKGVVMLGKEHSHYENVKYLIARMYAKKSGIPYINFYTHMPNDRTYVVERINKFLTSAGS